jgi:cell wall-associated NlpC family hydrolase
VPQPLAVTSTVGPDAVVAGVVPLVIATPGRAIDHVDFALDGTGIATATADPYELDLDTTRLADGPHRLAVNVAFAGGGSAIAVWTVTVANLSGALSTAPGPPLALPLAKSSLPSAPTSPGGPAAARPLYRATSPAQPVTVKQLDAALVGYLGFAGAAREIQATLAAAGLRPPANTGTEAVARMLGLRLNHPAGQDGLELLPTEAATRAEAAWSFAQLLGLDDAARAATEQAAGSFALPPLSDWQRRILSTAVRYVGYPYVWGGTSPDPQTLFGARVPGGFDCSGFVWRVYKLTPYAGEGTLASVLRGRTTFEMSGEVPRGERLPASQLEPADVLFFGARGPRSKPSEVDHAAIYLGGGWFVQSSGEGVTLLPFAGWYADHFAWARRPLHEAGLE